MKPRIPRRLFAARGRERDVSVYTHKVRTQSKVRLSLQVEVKEHAAPLHAQIKHSTSVCVRSSATHTRVEAKTRHTSLHTTHANRESLLYARVVRR